jgi:glycosyltransferase involved in cell wall biosynthesis
VKVCWTGSFVPDFERNLRIREYLEAADIDYREIRVNLWPADRVEAFTQRRLLILFRMAVSYPVLLFRLLIAPTPDLYLVSYPGWFDVPIVKLMAWVRRRPLVFDIFISLYDTAITDRELVRSSSPIARVSRAVDRLSMRLSQRVIADCPAHARFLAALGNLPLERFGVVYIGADESVFMATPDNEEETDLILFYGTFAPLQGVEWIVRAAALLKDHRYRFRVIGRGQDTAAVLRLADELGTSNVQFIDPVPKEKLVYELAHASLCLGIFGTSPKTTRVIPHKVFEGLACGRPVLTGDSEAIRDVFSHGEVATCRVGDPESLASQITNLMENKSRRTQLAVNARARFQRDFSRDPQALRLRSELEMATRATR